MADHKPIFKQDAKSIVDLLFESKILRDGITRDDMDAVQDFVQYCLESRYQLYLNGQNFLKEVQSFKMNSENP